MVDALHRKCNVFEAEGTHVKFQKSPQNHFKIDRKKFTKWIKGHIKKLSKVQNKQLKEAQNKQGQPVQLNPQDTCESLLAAVEGS